MGTLSLVANYSGDTSFLASASTPVNVTVTKGPTVSAVVSSLTTVPAGSPVTFNVTINTNSVGNAPGGTVTFLSGGVAIANAGNPAPVSGTSGVGNISPTPPTFTVAAGTATLTTTLPIGADNITAQYNGDANYSASTSPVIVVNSQPDFTVTFPNTPLVVTRGVPNPIVVTIAGQAGYNGTVNFTSASCAGLPAESSCSFSPASVVGNGTSTLSVQTTAPKTASLRPMNWWATGSGGLFAAICLLGAGSKRRRGRFLMLLVFASIVTIVGCGGGHSGPPPDPGTPVGTYPVTVTATAGGISHTATFTLTVQ